MRPINRREFFHDSAGFAAALASAAALLEPGRAADKIQAPEKGSANEQLKVACIGVNGQGMSHVHGYANKHNCVITTICDVDSAVIGKAMAHVEKTQGKAPKYEQDLRRVLDDKSIDVISIATPNHWHALAAIWAMQRGKDVYVEKPVSHNVSEGRRMVEAARKYNRICQTGTQSRSNPGLRDSIAFIHSGKLGKISLSRGLCYKKRDSIGRVSGPQAPPATMDYDLWCGPAPNKPPMRKTKKGTVHYDWHWFWDYGNGDLGNQGIHEMDKARWGLARNELPRSVISVGGRFGYVDDGETANTQICLFDYGDATLIFEVRGLPTEGLKGAKVGNIFYGSEGFLVCPNYHSGVAYRPDGEVLAKFDAKGDHFGNFIAAVRSRKSSDLHADILEGHLSSALCHLGNISYRLGTMQPLTSEAIALGNSKDAQEALARMRDHLKTNQVPLESTSCRMGRKLLIDAKSETFTSDKEANAWLTREYRKGFEVPTTV